MGEMPEVPSSEHAIRVSGPKRRRERGILRLLWADRKASVGMVLFAIFVLLAIFGPALAPYNPNDISFVPSQPPSFQHWLGTTGNGQDVFSQLLWGTRGSVLVGLIAGCLGTCVAILVGMLPAFKGGAVDLIASTFTNIILVLPGLPLLIIVASYLQKSGTVTIAIIIGLTGWAWGARVLRSQTLTLAQRDFVIAAKLSGSSDLRVLFTEILPNMVSLVIAHLMFTCLAAVLAEAGLQFLGIAQVTTVTWGSMLYWAESGEALLNGDWWWLIPPGLAIALLGGSFALMNFGVDQIANPRLRTAMPRKWSRQR